MKKSFVASALGPLVGLLLGLAAPASAAPPTIYNWTGCYLGLQGGGTVVSSTWISSDRYGSGVLAGGQIGCNVQSGSLVAGIEAEGWWSGLTQRDYFTSSGIPDEILAKNRWDAALSARAGFAFDRALLYGKAGIAWGRFEFTEDQRFGGGGFNATNGSEVLPGLLLGVGLEYAFAPNWSAKLEYNYINYGLNEVTFTRCDETGACDRFTQTQAAQKQIVKFGLNYRFGAGLPLPMPQIASPATARGAVYDWTGCYLGLHGGGGVMTSTFVSTRSYGAGGFWGGQAGCNIQTGMVVFGVEAEAWSGFKQKSRFTSPTDISETATTNRWDVDIAARIGFAVDRALFYGKTGVVWGGFDFAIDDRDPTDPTSLFTRRASSTLTGLLLGAGIEYAVTGNWTVKAEYNYINYLSKRITYTDCDFFGCDSFVDQDSAHKQLIKIGVNYRFGAPEVTLPFLAMPATASTAISNWTGCYLGAHGGGGVMTSTWTSTTRYGGGGLGGGQIGCNYQIGMTVFGIEAEAWWSGMSQDERFSSGTFTEDSATKSRWGADVAVRAGFAVERVLLYAKTGIAWSRFEFAYDNNDPESIRGSVTLPGLLLGAGIEYAFAPNWSAKLEYNYINFAARPVSFIDCFGGVCDPFTETHGARQQIVKAGINYRFGGQGFAPPPPRTVHNWTGCYLGVHGGGGLMNSTWVTTSSFGGGAVAGGQAGCNVQTGSIVYGLEAEAWWSGLTQKDFDAGTAIFETIARNRWDVDVAARLGIATNRALWYAKTGLAWGGYDLDFSFRIPAIPSNFLIQRGSVNLMGLLLAGGVEYAIVGNWSGKLEYNYINYFNSPVAITTCDASACSVDMNSVAAHKQVVKAGLNYRFTSGAPF